MKKEAYRSKSGRRLFRPIVSEQALEKLMVADDEHRGFCLACGQTAYGVEPDARRYPCDHCEEPKVYGIEELLLMGILQVK